MSTKHICDSAMQAVADIPDGASILVHSFGPPQAWPTDCLLALAERGVRDLTIICNTPAGERTVARSDDPALLDEMMRREFCGTIVEIAEDGAFSGSPRS